MFHCLQIPDTSMGRKSGLAMRLLDIYSKLLTAKSAGALIAGFSLAFSFASHAQVAPSVLQRGYDASVTGATLGETKLNTSNVAVNTFGLVFRLPLDDSVLAQPLYVPNVAIPNHGSHNVVYVATLSDTLYAFDADVGGSPLWSTNLASLFHTTPVQWADFAISDIFSSGNLGILSTPVIDPSTNVMYVVACTLESSTMAYRLHAIDITTGAEPYGPGVLILGSYGGSTFDARYQTQRMSLVLSGNQVVFGFGAMEHESAGNYVGWVMAYNKRTLQQSGVFATVTTGGRGGGVWQSGRPPVVDGSGYVYLFVGNAYGSGYDGVNDFSESALKFDPSQNLVLLDWFTPGNWSYLDAHDQDLTGSGPLLIPGTSLLAGGGKTGDLYVLNTANLGKFNATDSQVVQKENIAPGGTASLGIRGGPVYWQRSIANGGPLFYDWAVEDWVKAFSFSGGKLAPSPSSQGSGNQFFPGGILTLSADGEQHGSGVLWAATNEQPHGELHAFDAENVAHELWNSAMNPARDSYGDFALFVPPLVANGRVYVATASKQLAAYGLFPTYTVSPTSLMFGAESMNLASAPMLITVTDTGNVALPITGIAISGTDSTQFAQTNACGDSVAVGSHCTISVVFKPTVAGSKAATLNVNAGGVPVTAALSGVVFSVSITASAATVMAGTSATLTWSATSGTVCSALGGSVTDGWSGTVPASGTKTVTESTPGTYVYRLSCTAGSQVQQAQTSVMVTLPPATKSGGGSFDELALMVLLAFNALVRLRQPVPTPRRR
jgi:hypothetical protein